MRKVEGRVDRGRFSCHSVGWSALYEVHPAGETTRLGIEHSYPTNKGATRVALMCANAFRGG